MKRKEEDKKRKMREKTFRRRLSEVGNKERSSIKRKAMRFFPTIKVLESLR